MAGAIIVKQLARLVTFLFLTCLLGCRGPSREMMKTNSNAELQRLMANLDAAMTQADMNLASFKITEFWDAKLAALEKRIEQKLGSVERKEFSKAEANWRRYRMEEVQFRTDMFAGGGSIQPLTANANYSQITEQRIAEVESIWAEASEIRENQ